jgi:hypothetical protein
MVTGLDENAYFCFENVVEFHHDRDSDSVSLKTNDAETREVVVNNVVAVVPIEQTEAGQTIWIEARRN